MPSDSRKSKDKLNQSSWSWPWIVASIILFLGLVAIFFFSLFTLIYSIRIGDSLGIAGLALKSYSVGLIMPWQTSPCYDGESCSADIVLGDYTCIHRPYIESHDCSDEDICYLPTTTAEDKLLYPKYCRQGRCVSSRARCLGTCASNGLQLDDPSTCNFSLFPLMYDQFQNVSLSCIFGACTLFTISPYNPMMPLNDANLFLNMTQTPQNVFFALSKCIQYDCSVSGSQILCVFRYFCATYDFGNNLLDSLSTQSNDMYASETELRLKIASIKNRVGSVKSKHVLPLFGQSLSRQEHDYINERLDMFMESFNRH